MRNENDIATGLSPLPEKVKNDGAQFAVQGARGFVEDEDWSLDLKRSQQGKALLLASAQIAPPFVEFKFQRACPEAIVQPKFLDQQFHPLFVEDGTRYPKR